MTTSVEIPIKEMFDKHQGEMSKLSKEMNELRMDMRAYNGLRKSLDDALIRITQLEQDKAKSQGRSQVWDGLKGWIPVAIGAAGFILGRFIK